MRDPKRIDEFCEILKKVWHKEPDWRFGQIIENIKRGYGINDIFYIEDDTMINMLKLYFNDETITQEEINDLIIRFNLKGE